MDYCSSCRRNLNGALVCPGCGAYAPDIAPPAHRPRNAAAATPRATWDAFGSGEFPSSEFHRGTAHSGTGVTGRGTSGGSGAEAPGAGSSSSEEPAAPAVQGRAARRRQLARWKKSRRRAAVASAVALVGGGLAFTALPTGSSNTHSDTASAPDISPQATSRIGAPDSPSAQPDDRASRHPGTRPAPTTTSPRRGTAAVEPPTAAASPPPRTAATAHPTATTSAPPQATPTASRETQTHRSGPEPSRTTAPTDRSDTDTSTASSAPKPSSPEKACLLVVCVD
ncbi:SCO2400 family protein [Streptomyces sp. 8N616]|uniref:SCO2400 family protein n=1 Tax=Streptomyces sp. 8N616 TaxID=3457414 RepID=UPI003FD0A1A9